MVGEQGLKPGDWCNRPYTYSGGSCPCVLPWGHTEAHVCCCGVDWFEDDTHRLRVTERVFATLEADAAALRGRVQALETALERWLKLDEAGYRHRGVGIGQVLIRKWDADEARYWSRKALGKDSLAALLSPAQKEGGSS